MRPITEIRRDRLRQLIAEVADGNQSRFAAMIGRSRAQVGFWLTDPSKPHFKALSHEMAREIEAEMRRRFGSRYVDGWLDTDPASQVSGLDVDILGVALTSMDRVIRARGLRMEGHLGRYANVLAFAYGAAQLEFPSGPPSPDTSTGKAALKAFDRKVDEYLGGAIIANGQVAGPAGTGETGVGQRPAKRTTTSRRRR